MRVFATLALALVIVTTTSGLNIIGSGIIMDCTIGGVPLTANVSYLSFVDIPDDDASTVPLVYKFVID
jgi:hypothetical protein